MIMKFFGATPHPFNTAMQNPSRMVLLGYSYEHHHFLKQWIRSCSLIIGNTENEDVQYFEIENILSEWFGIPSKQQAHHELLLRMGESCGTTRSDIYNTIPLNATKRAAAFCAILPNLFTFTADLVDDQTESQSNLIYLRVH